MVLNFTKSPLTPSAIALVLVLAAIVMYSHKTSVSLPPGPGGWPWFGAIFGMPSQEDWPTFSAWADKWGDMCHFKVLGQDIIVVNSFQIAKDMLNRKSGNYSDRPVLQVGGELVGYKNTTGLLRYGPRHQTQRAFFHRVMGTNIAMKDINPIEEFETRRFLKQMLARPDSVAENVRRTTGAIILKVSHGYDVQGDKDLFIEMADKVLDDVSEATAPGAFVADMFPIFSYLPDWFPGAGFKSRAAVWRARLIELVEQPHNLVKDQIRSGTAKKSFTSSLLEETNLVERDEDEIKWTAASIFSGGADTTVGSIMAFFLAMTLYPDVQKKAQEEIDAVIGNDALPLISDRERLPYVNALTLEVLRWHAVVPAALPHRVVQEDIHEGYLIPKDALVLPNIWKMSHDPTIYSTPMAFNPSRYLGEDPETDPREMTFGYGRRICPGKLVADASLFINCAMTLAVFNIVTPGGARAKGDLKPTPGSISHPTQFKVAVSPRSDRAVALINEANDNP